MSLIINIVIVASLFFAFILFVLKKQIFSATDKDLKRLHDARIRTEQKQEELEEKRKKCDEECKEKILQAEQEGERIRNDGLGDADKRSKESEDRARTHAEEIIKKANDSVILMRQNIVKEMDRKAIDFAIKVIVETLSETLSKKMNEDLAREFLKELQDVGTKHVGDVKTIDIVTRYNLPSSIKDEVKNIFTKKLKRNIDIKETIDEAVIGGMMLKFGTLALDGSFAKKIRDIAEKYKKDLEA